MNEKIDVTKTVLNFLNFLNAGWESYKQIIPNKEGFEKEDHLDNWFEANWEIFVEFEICSIDEVLKHYGNGADNSDGTNKLIYGYGNYTNKIICSSQGKIVYDIINKKEIIIDDYDFERFVSVYNDDYYDIKAPFTHALYLDPKRDEYMAPVEELIFLKTPWVSN